ncbi:MAG: methionine biosynthesis protein MetW [Nitrososphaerota archaeon]|nr:methionine biosynthesis protein MetW [Nitrososphaerota archaeon]
MKIEYEIIADWIKEGSSVLDLGCGDGTLLATLIAEKKVHGQGTEIDEQAIYKCVEKGLSVYHEDIETGLPNYETGTFDYVIMSGSLQQVKKPDPVIDEALRVGKHLVVSFPNFAHYSVRMQILLHGKVPVTPSLPYEWHNSPNVHFLSIVDFVHYCNSRKIDIDDAAYVSSEKIIHLLPNVFAESGIFLLTRK